MFKSSLGRLLLLLSRVDPSQRNDESTCGRLLTIIAVVMADRHKLMDGLCCEVDSSRRCEEQEEWTADTRLMERQDRATVVLLLLLRW